MLRRFARERSAGAIPSAATVMTTAVEERAHAREASLDAYDEALQLEAESAEVPPDLLKALCWYASGWRQYEPGGKVLQTPMAFGTSIGCMQLNDVWHPDAFPAAQHSATSNIRYSARLVRWLYDQTGDWDRAIVAYFGHDRRAELAGRRVRKYEQRKPWADRLRPPGETDRRANTLG